MKYSTKAIFQSDFLQSNLKLHLADVGARENLPDPWRYMDPDHLHVVGFEPDAEECARLQKTYTNRTYFPVGLWSGESEQILHLNENPATSSLYPVNPEFENWFADAHCIQRTLKKKIPIKTSSLDLLAPSSLPVDFLKIDTQGAEYEILKGSIQTLARTQAIVVAEAWNLPIYQGAPVAAEIISLMHLQGYFPLDMVNTACWLYKNSLQNWLGAKDRTTGIDIIFIPYLSRLKTEDQDSLLKKVMLLELFGYRDLALMIAERMLPEDGKLQLPIRTIFKKNGLAERTLLMKISRNLRRIFRVPNTDFAPIHD